jgi:hypothetical protein
MALTDPVLGITQSGNTMFNLVSLSITSLSYSIDFFMIEQFCVT